MKRLIGLVAVCIILIVFAAFKTNKNSKIVSFTVDTKTQNLEFFWKDDNGVNIKNIRNLKLHVENKQKRLRFAMNGGMFNRDLSPKGLYIQESKLIIPLDTLSGSGNFYLKPNGVFYLTTSCVPVICKTTEFKLSSQIKFATQSGPMLVIEGEIHPGFKKGSANLNIRNGVGILPNSHVVFAISEEEINLYDFALFFKELGCTNALYLDGFVSRMYLPEKNWYQSDGDFGVLIGLTAPL